MLDNIKPARHKPVLLHESIDGLNLEDGKVFVDATFGAGGHTKEVKGKFPGVRTISIDQDPGVGADITGNFRGIDTLLPDTQPDAILLDIGISSDQIDSSGRGFSFQKDEPLDMRMGETELAAADILNSWDEPAIELILRGFAEERFSKQIAKAIVEKRSSFAKASQDKKTKAFQTTTDLVETILEVKPRHFRDKIHPATKTFQALRIAVNGELDALEQGLEKSFDKLKVGGRLAVISFHSLEDRIVKNFFRDRATENKAKLITKKPITPSDEEIKENPRSRSAKLRILEKICEE